MVLITNRIILFSLLLFANCYKFDDKAAIFYFRYSSIYDTIFSLIPTVVYISVIIFGRKIQNDYEKDQHSRKRSK